jgi:hypothetical protein
MPDEQPEQGQAGQPAQAPAVQAADAAGAGSANAGGNDNAGNANASADDNENSVALENSANAVEKTRARMGLLAVAISDTAIALAAILAVYWIHETKSTSPSIDPIVSILTSAFTAIGTLTTAYFGIKATANMAKNVSKANTGSGKKQ